MKQSVLFIFVLLFSEIHSTFSQSVLPYQNPSLSFEQRANDLVSRMTVDEKISQMLHAAPAISRLRIPAYNWWNECLHGVGRSNFNVTVFPQAIGLAATFNPTALQVSASYISDEARAIFNETNRTTKQGSQYHGLTFWTPNINIFRDPRWGRGQETYGEDPYLTARMGMAMVNGLQGNDPKFLKTAACAKHYAVHSGPEPGRNSFNSIVGMYDLWDTYLPAFESLITKAKVAGVMCAYNRMNGQPCCGNDFLLTDILRNQWNFKGYVTSDCGAINDFTVNHKTHATPQSAAADAVLHGTDLECGEVYVALKDALAKGLVSEDDINKCVRRLFVIRMRLGMFETAGSVPYDSITLSNLECRAHQAQALQMARQSVVLLKNNGTLPIHKTVKRILLTGPNADNADVLLGNYNGLPSKTITPLMALKDLENVEIVYKKSTEILIDNKSDIQKALAELKNVDAVIFVGGISPRLEGEEGDAGTGNPEGFHGGDRTDIALPAVQTEFMKQVKLQGKPLIFVCMSGSAIGFDWEAVHADAILQAWYGGQAAGTAIADIICGKYNPSGRLPLTWYSSTTDLPAMEDYSMVNRTYRYFAGKALYPFGYGLSYTNFAYKWIMKPTRIMAVNDTLEACVEVTNKGKWDGSEVAQVYITYPSGKGFPHKELRSFNRMDIRTGKSERYDISIPVSDLKKWDEDRNDRIVPKGKYGIYVGTHSEDMKLISTFEIK
ncbi:MAG: glycoside hydrolase family 3 C-terminal domain-containing protein [Bacteroidota bacterium]|nr:glycoside hydrolase family 3 C-terminal domain-containing protein [Bacteroidota bacterium]